MFRTRTIKGTIETGNIKTLSEKIDELAADNQYFRMKQEEYDREKNRGVIQKIRDYFKRGNDGKV